MNKLLSILLVLSMFLSLCSGFCMAETSENDLPGVLVDLSYIDDGSDAHKLNIFLDENAESKQPLILEIHGGGFFGGSKETNTDHCLVYQAAGFAVAAPNYTLMPESNFKDIIQEIFAFLNWVETNADEYNFDMDHAFMSGDSAGAFIVLLTAAVLASPELQDYYEVTPPTFGIEGYALTCPVTDLPALAKAFDEGKGFVGFMAGQMGEAVLKDEDSFNRADLYQVIDPETFPAVYFITTPTDANFYGDSVKLDAFLTENGVAHTYTEYVGTDGDLVHVFNVTSPDTEDGQLANQEMIDYVKSLMGAEATIR